MAKKPMKKPKGKEKDMPGKPMPFGKGMKK